MGHKSNAIALDGRSQIKVEDTDDNLSFDATWRLLLRGDSTQDVAEQTLTFAIRDAWERRPLQLALFGEQLAGENFFHRLEALRARGSVQVQLEGTTNNHGDVG